jgi:hypothetical protein
MQAFRPLNDQLNVLLDLRLCLMPCVNGTPLANPLRVKSYIYALVSAVALSLAACATPGGASSTIQGRDPHRVVLLAKNGVEAKGVRLPPGYYYPVLEHAGGGLGKQSSYVVYMHPEGLMTKNLLGQWSRAEGGILIECDPSANVPNTFIYGEGTWGGRVISPGVISLVAREDAWNCEEAETSRRRLANTPAPMVSSREIR